MLSIGKAITQTILGRTLELVNNCLAPPIRFKWVLLSIFAEKTSVDRHKTTAMLTYSLFNRFSLYSEGSPSKLHTT